MSKICCNTHVTPRGYRVPVESIELSAPQLQGADADQYEIVDYKVTRKLAQRPGSYVVLEYRRPVLKHKPSATLMEVPAPSAVFDTKGVEFTISVPFERFAALMGLIENRKRWRRLSGQLSFFETKWKPESWKDRYRFVFVRSENRKRYKGAVQLDLFIPYEYGYDFKVIVTNKRTLCKKRR